ncbi:MAG: hypothetical protein JNG84_12555 [Archangium sp.]|nr:hypothetical protein [Archangium sp.]
MRQLSTFVLCAAVALGASGCLSSRVMKSVVQSGEKNVTLVQTWDTYSVLMLWPYKATHQFWKCSEVPGSMTCLPVCDAKGSDLMCPPMGAYTTTSNSIQ